MKRSLAFFATLILTAHAAFATYPMMGGMPTGGMPTTTSPTMDQSQMLLMSLIAEADVLLGFPDAMGDPDLSEPAEPDPSGDESSDPGVFTVLGMAGPGSNYIKLKELRTKLFRKENYLGKLKMERAAREDSLEGRKALVAKLAAKKAEIIQNGNGSALATAAAQRIQAGIDQLNNVIIPKEQADLDKVNEKIDTVLEEIADIQNQIDALEKPKEN